MKSLELGKKSNLAEKLLRALKPQSSMRESISLQKDDHHVTPDVYHAYQPEIKTAMLEAELRKAEGTTEWEKWHKWRRI